eukprot:sb/3476582/
MQQSTSLQQLKYELAKADKYNDLLNSNHANTLLNHLQNTGYHNGDAQPPATPNIWGNDVTWQQILSSRPTSVAAGAGGGSLGGGDQGALDSNMQHLINSYDRSLVMQLQLDDIEY